MATFFFIGKALALLALTGWGAAILTEGISGKDPWGIGFGLALLVGAGSLFIAWL